MASSYTTLLGLVLPVTGELSGTWGDVVNASLTNLLDSAIAGTTTLSTDADVTLTSTQGAANQARQAVLLCSGARTALRTVTAPAQSKTYVIINATTGGYAVKLVGSGPTTGVTIQNGRYALVAWNGSDFVVVASGDVAGPSSSTDNTLPRFDGTTGKVLQTSGVSIDDSNNITGIGTLTASGSGSFGTLASSGALTVGSNATITGGLGAATLTSSGSVAAVTLAVSGGATIASTLNVAGGVLFADTTNSRVGVNTAAPAYTFQVGGAMGATAYTCRSGLSGSYRGNAFNIDFVSNIPYLYIDTSNLGQISLISDRRIKKDVTNLEGAVERVRKLRPVAYRMRDVDLYRDDGMTRSGFIADELQAVIPSAVFGEKDSLTSDGKIQPQSLVWGPLVAELTAALQDALRRIEILEAKE